MPREALRLVRETTFNVFPTSPSPADICLISLPQSNSFTVRAKPNKGSIRAVSQQNRRVLSYSFTSDIGGNLMTHVRPSQAAYLLGLAYNLSSGNCADLGSFSCDHAIMLEDGSCSPSYRRYTGCKLDAAFTVNTSLEGCLMMLNGTIQACGTAAITDSDFPMPAATDYPDNERPYAFYDVAGHLSVNGARTDYAEFGFKFGNIIKPVRTEGRYPSRLTYRGRDPEFTIRTLYKSKQDRIDYEANTARAIDFKFTSPDGHAVEFNLNTQNYIMDLADDLPIDDAFFQSATWANHVDTGTGSDFVMTLTAPTPPANGGS